MIDNERVEVVARALHREMSPGTPWCEPPVPLPRGVKSLFGYADTYRRLARVALEADAESLAP
jgi:hypothetical protein